MDTQKLYRVIATHWDEGTYTECWCEFRDEADRIAELLRKSDHRATVQIDKPKPSRDRPPQGGRATARPNVDSGAVPSSSFCYHAEDGTAIGWDVRQLSTGKRYIALEVGVHPTTIALYPSRQTALALIDALSQAVVDLEGGPPAPPPAGFGPEPAPAARDDLDLNETPTGEGHG
jgi:hypothetical protein